MASRLRVKHGNAAWRIAQHWTLPLRRPSSVPTRVKISVHQQHCRQAAVAVSRSERQRQGDASQGAESVCPAASAPGHDLGLSACPATERAPTCGGADADACHHGGSVRDVPALRVEQHHNCQSKHG